MICNNEIWSSSDGHIWKRTKQNTYNSSFDSIKDFEGRHTAGYIVFKNKMWIIGGDANQGHYQSDIWNSSNGNNWNLVLSKAPWGPRSNHYTVTLNNKIYVIGGQTLPQYAPAKDTIYNDVWCSNDGIKWKLISNNLPFSPRGMICGSVVFKNKIWILGGGTFETPQKKIRKFYNDVWNSEDGTNWNLITKSAPWSQRQYHSIIVFDNKIWVIADFDKNQNNTNDVWFSDDGLNWKELPNSPWKERHATSVYVLNNSLYIIAGNNMENDVWKLEKI